MSLEGEDHVELHLRRALEHLETAMILADARGDSRGDRVHAVRNSVERALKEEDRRSPGE